EQSAAAAEELNRQAEGLRMMVMQFKTADQKLAILTVGKEDHQRFMDTLHKVISGKTEASKWPFTDSKHCRFAKWYYSQEGKAYSHVHEYAVIEEPHQRVHNFGNDAVKALMAGNRQLAQKLLGQAESASHEVFAALEKFDQALSIAGRV
ncbi:methyl-accepting chemotaxis protein, partial [sediment metagenome]